MLKKIISYITLITFITYTLSCSTTPKRPKSQLEIREYQTRTFEVKDKNLVIKALVNTLMDEGYIIKEANTDLGIVTGEKGYDIEKEAVSQGTSIWGYILAGLLIVSIIGIIFLVSGNTEDKKETDDKDVTTSPSLSDDKTYEKNKIMELTANASEYGENVKVRLLFQEKILNNKGEVVKIEQIEDSKFYQDFFAKLDKSIFLQKELDK